MEDLGRIIISTLMIGGVSILVGTFIMCALDMIHSQYFKDTFTHKEFMLGSGMLVALAIIGVII